MWRQGEHPVKTNTTHDAEVAVSPRSGTERSYVPPRTIDPGLAGLVNRDAGIDARISADISSKIPSVKDARDFPALIEVLCDVKDDDTVRNEVANLLTRSKCPDLVDALIKVLNAPEEKARFRSFCIQHLWMNYKDAGKDERIKIMGALEQALSDKDVPVRREALLALVRERQPKAQELAIKWLSDPESNGVRDLAIRCVKDLDLRDQIPTVRKYLRDADEPTRIAAIVALSQWGDQESRPAFEEAASSKSVRLQRAGTLALKTLDGKKEKQP
jgi:HEAT repeat protein